VPECGALAQMNRPITDRCRYCGVTTDDPAAGGPDDVAVGVCPTCLNTRMGTLLEAALILLPDLHPDMLKTWVRDQMVKFGVTPVWAERFVENDEFAFALARERLG
jgi:hypothetical protein